VLIVTAGIAILLQEVAVLAYSTEPRYVPTAISGSFAIMHVRVTYQQLVTIVVAIALVFALHAFLVRSRLWRQLRAVAQDTEMAARMGFSVGRVYLSAMVTSTGLAAAAGALVAPFLTVSPDMGWSPLLVAFTIVVLGGLGSLWGTIIAAFIVAYAEMLTAFLISPQLRDAVTFAIMIATLSARTDSSARGLSNDAPSGSRAHWPCCRVHRACADAALDQQPLCAFGAHICSALCHLRIELGRPLGLYRPTQFRTRCFFRRGR